MPVWLVDVRGEVTDEVTAALTGAGMSVTSRRYGRVGLSPSHVHAFTVRVDALNTEDAAARVAGVLGESFDVGDIRPSGA